MGYAHRAAAGGAVAAVVDVPHGRRAIEAVDPTDESRDAIRRAMRAVLGRLGVPDAGSPVEA
ncbi:hypothetical protein ACF1FY_04430 [Streptomyces althioticus]|uniref:hypothetical protein n=1 Tax=Streptomyces althioticus TaxID=83380 RepID=UPI0036F4C147